MLIKIVNRVTASVDLRREKKGAVEIADLGPRTPFHDFAHFVVERRLKLAKGFFGHIYNGYTVKQLSDKEVIRTLPPEIWVSEIVARALQSLSSGACQLKDFNSLIEAELTHLGIASWETLRDEEVVQMLSDFNNLISHWNELREGEYVELVFELEELVQ
jgi:hypothetical protein